MRTAHIIGTATAGRDHERPVLLEPCSIWHSCSCWHLRGSGGAVPAMVGAQDRLDEVLGVRLEIWAPHNKNDANYERQLTGILRTARPSGDRSSARERSSMTRALSPMAACSSAMRASLSASCAAFASRRFCARDGCGPPCHQKGPLLLRHVLHDSSVHDFQDPEVMCSVLFAGHL